MPQALHLQSELLPRQAQLQPRQPWPRSHSLFPAQEPPGHGWRETASISRVSFSVCKSFGPPAAPQQWRLGHPHCAPREGASAVGTPVGRWSSSPPKAASWCDTTLFTQKSFFFFFPLKTNIILFYFYHVELCQNKPVWPQSVDSPNLKLRMEASSLWLVLSRKTQRDKVRVGRPFQEAPDQERRGSGSELQLQAGSQHQAARSLSRDLTAFSLGPETSGKGVLGHRHSGSRRKRHRPCPPAVSPWPLAAPLPVTKPAHSTPPRPHLGCGVREPAGSPALANYCDVSTPLPRPSFWMGFPRPPHPLQFPSLEPVPPPPLAFVTSSSDHSNHFGDLIVNTDECKL